MRNADFPSPFRGEGLGEGRENSLDEILSTIALCSIPSSPKKMLFRGEGTGGIASYVAGWMAGKGMDVIVLDGANRFNPYIASSFARKGLISPEKILKRIRIARAFTCYQMATLMGKRLPSLLNKERTNSKGGKPQVILLGPITTFLDEDVSEREIRPLFDRSLSKVEEMAAAGVPFFLFQAPISNPPRPPFAKGGFSRRADLMRRLTQFSNWIWRIEVGDKEPKIILERGISSVIPVLAHQNASACRRANGNPETWVPVVATRNRAFAGMRRKQTRVMGTDTNYGTDRSSFQSGSGTGSPGMAKISKGPS